MSNEAKDESSSEPGEGCLGYLYAGVFLLILGAVLNILELHVKNATQSYTIIIIGTGTTAIITYIVSIFYKPIRNVPKKILKVGFIIIVIGLISQSLYVIVPSITKEVNEWWTEQQGRNEAKTKVLEALDDGTERTYNHIWLQTGLSHKHLQEALRTLERQGRIKHNRKELLFRKYWIEW